MAYLRQMLASNEIMLIYPLHFNIGVQIYCIVLSNMNDFFFFYEIH
jgi:hypothetical protein